MNSKVIKSESNLHSQDQSSYRQIFKATSIFGGVQIFNILIGIVRVKIIAILLGTKGVGIIGLLNSPLQVITSITGLGISFSAVRDVSEANGSDDQIRISTTITSLRRWSWFTGLLGTVLTFSLAPVLSQWSFGNKEYIWAFMLLSVTLLLQAISKSQSAILQGTRKLKEMAKAGVLGSALGLLTSIPFYLLYGIKGIVPALLLTAVTNLLLSWFYARKVIIKRVDYSTCEIYRSGLRMAKLGISMTLAGFLASLTAYILNAYISNRGGIEQVGLYNAGWGVVGQYTAVIFAAMGTDYFPRLSAIQADNENVKKLVNQQIETALLILTPLLALLIVFMPLVVRILYTPAFLPVVMFAIITILGIPFKAVSWALGYVYLAKGDGKLFLIMEVISGSVVLIFNLLFYNLYGLNGLGVSFIITYILGMIFSFFVLKKKYNFAIPKNSLLQFTFLFGIIFLAFLSGLINTDLYRHIAGVIAVTIAIIYSLKKLNELMDFSSLFQSIWNKYKQR